MAKRVLKSKATGYVSRVLPTQERHQHNGGVLREAVNDVASVRIRRHRAMFASILEAYLWHGKISELEYQAGLKFYREYARSVLRIKIYEAGAGNHGDLEMSALSAINGNALLRQAFAVLSPAQCEIIISVCVDNNRAGTGRKLKYLAIALNLLAKTWRL